MIGQITDADAWVTLIHLHVCNAPCGEPIE